LPVRAQSLLNAARPLPVRKLVEQAQVSVERVLRSPRVDSDPRSREAEFRAEQAPRSREEQTPPHLASSRQAAVLMEMPALT
jgi:hypothetical protein